MNIKELKEVTPRTVEEEGTRGDELVECELEAAQALACLAHNTASTSNVGEAEVDDESLVPVSSGGSEEQAIPMQFEQETGNITSPQQTLNYPPGPSRKSRQNLTEEEKEERRLCRVLANRESARQTIRRRQAVYEELTRKAADLASENDNLKKIKELAAKEYDILKNENSHLTEQIAILEKAEAEETDGYARSTPLEISTTNTAPTPTPAPPLFNQSPITPFFWPSVVQPFNSFLLQCGSQNVSGITSMLPSPASGELNSIERSTLMNNPGNPLFVLPLPYLIPFHAQSSPFLPWSSDLTDRHAETSSVHPCSTSYLNTENNQEATALEAETGAPDSVKAMQRDFLHVAGTSRQIHSCQQDNTRDVMAVSSTVEQLPDSSEKALQECITCSSQKSADAIAAKEARKRRKELLKWRSQHGDRPGPHH